MKSESSLEVWRAKIKFYDNLGHNIFEQCFITDPINHR